MLAIPENSRESFLQRRLCYLWTSVEEQIGLKHDSYIDFFVCQRMQRGFDLFGPVRIGRNDLLTQPLSCGLKLGNLRSPFRINIVSKQANFGCAWHYLARQLNLLGRQSADIGLYARHVSSGSCLARNQAQMHRVSERGADDWDS
jgi:hypothetical protein